MKTLLKLVGSMLPLFGIMIFLFISCKEDEEIEPLALPNEIKINNKTYVLKEGFISTGMTVTDVNNQSGNYYRVILIGSGLTRNTEMAGLWFSGSGCQLIISFYSKGSSLADGNYTTSDYANNSVVLNSARFVFIEDLFTPGGVQYRGESGTITLKKSANKTTIEWDLQTMENMNFTFVPAKGSYQGELKEYE